MKVKIRNCIPVPASEDARSGKAEVEVELQAGSAVSDIFTILGIKETAAGLILINGKLAQNESILKDGDSVSLFPEIVGG